MNAKDLTTIDQLSAFLEGTQRVAFEVASDKDSRPTSCTLSTPDR